MKSLFCTHPGPSQLILQPPSETGKRTPLLALMCFLYHLVVAPQGFGWPPSNLPPVRRAMKPANNVPKSCGTPISLGAWGTAELARGGGASSKAACLGRATDKPEAPDLKYCLGTCLAPKLSLVIVGGPCLKSPSYCRGSPSDRPFGQTRATVPVQPGRSRDRPTLRFPSRPTESESPSPRPQESQGRERI